MKKTKLTSSLLVTIILVILLITALSTATFAWFSSNNVVDVSTIDFVAAVRDGDGELMVGWDDYLHNWEKDITWDDFVKTYVNELGFVTFDLPMAVEFRQVSPCMPTVAPTKGMTGAEFLDSFQTAQTTLKYDAEKQEIREVYFRDGVPYTPPCTVRDDLGQDWAERSTFYLYNMNPDFDMNVTITHSYIGNLHRKLRVAVFVNGALQGILSHNERIYYGKIEEDAYVDENIYFVNRALTYDSMNPDVNAEELPGTDDEYVGSWTDVSQSEFSFVVKHHDTVSVRLYCWFDGFNMTNDDIGETGGLTEFRFHGEYIETLNNQTQTN